MNHTVTDEAEQNKLTEKRFVLRHVERVYVLFSEQPLTNCKKEQSDVHVVTVSNCLFFGLFFILLSFCSFTCFVIFCCALVLTLAVTEFISLFISWYVKRITKSLASFLHVLLEIHPPVNPNCTY